jgi:AraC-like DNA-binding protein
MPQTPFATYHFSTDELPEPDRKGIWREVVSRQFIGMDSEPLADVPFYVALNARDLPGLTIGDVMLSGTHDKRSRETLNDGKSDFALCINLYGDYVISHRGRELTVQAGEAVLQSMGETGTYVRPVLGGGFGLRLPRETLSALIPQLDDFSALPIPSDNSCLLLLVQYTEAVNKLDRSAPVELQQAAASHLLELVALTMWSAHGARVEASRRGARAAMLHRIKIDVLQNLHRTDLSLGFVADRAGLSSRTVQRLFTEEQTSFSEFVTTERLSRVVERLRDPRLAGSTVATLALECGFGDMSTFYKYFRERYGASPMDVRNAAMIQRQ